MCFKTLFRSGQRRKDFQLRFRWAEVCGIYISPGDDFQISKFLMLWDIEKEKPMAVSIGFSVKSRMFFYKCKPVQTFTWNGQRRTDFEENQTLIDLLWVSFWSALFLDKNRLCWTKIFLLAVNCHPATIFLCFTVFTSYKFWDRFSSSLKRILQKSDDIQNQS